MSGRDDSCRSAYRAEPLRSTSSVISPFKPPFSSKPISLAEVVVEIHLDDLRGMNSSSMRSTSFREGPRLRFRQRVIYCQTEGCHVPFVSYTKNHAQNKQLMHSDPHMKKTFTPRLLSYEFTMYDVITAIMQLHTQLDETDNVIPRACMGSENISPTITQAPGPHVDPLKKM